MNLHNAWSQVFANLYMNDEGDKHMSAFTDAMNSNRSGGERLRAMTEDTNSVCFIADAEKNILIIHNVKNFGGFRTRPANKVGALIGLGPKATVVLIKESVTIKDCKVTTPTSAALLGCSTRVYKICKKGNAT